MFLKIGAAETKKSNEQKKYFLTIIVLDTEQIKD